MDTVPELLDALELAVELEGLFSSFMPDELAAEDAGCELLDAAGCELLAGAELAAVLDEDAADELLAVLELLMLLELLAKPLPELDGNSGSSGIPAQEVRIIAAITAAAAAPHTARKIGIFIFIWMHFLLHKFPLVKRLCCLVSVYSFRHGFVNKTPRTVCVDLHSVRGRLYRE